MNNWDSVLDYTCPSGKIITGFASYHDNNKEDRRFKIECTKVNKQLSNCQWSGYVNNWDGAMDYSLPGVTKALVGVQSVHDNHKE